jgi:hypothetical protein
MMTMMMMKSSPAIKMNPANKMLSTTSRTRDDDNASTSEKSQKSDSQQESEADESSSEESPKIGMGGWRTGGNGRRGRTGGNRGRGKGTGGTGKGRAVQQKPPKEVRVRGNATHDASSEDEPLAAFLIRNKKAKTDDQSNKPQRPKRGERKNYKDMQKGVGVYNYRQC